MGEQALGVLDGKPVWITMPPLATFTDREEYLAEICQFADQPRNSPGLVLIRGRQGMGKSALLARLGLELRSRYKHALTVDVGEYRTEGKVLLADLFAQVLEDLGVDARWIPADLRGRRNRYLAVTEGQNILLLVDGVTEAAQVRALLPNSDQALVVVASELSLDDLADEGCVPWELKGFRPAHGVQYLARVCPDGRIDAEPEQAARLSEFCGGMPLALRLVAGSLRSHRRLSVAEVVAELENDLNLESPERRRLQVSNKLTGTLALAYGRLPSAEARLYRLLGALPGRELPEQVIAVAADVPRDDLVPQLDLLVRYDLLEEVARAEYRLLDVVRLHARWIAADVDDQETIDAAVARSVTAWAELAMAADLGVQEDRFRVGARGSAVADAFADPAAAMAWFGRWHGSLLEVMRQAHARELDDAVWRIFETMWPFYSSHRHLQSRLDAGQMAVDSAKRAGNVRAEARVLCLHSRALRETDQLTVARACIDRAEELARAARDERLLASVLDFSGHCSLDEQDHQRALADFRQALAINEQLGDRRGIALQTQFVGRALARLGELDEALANFERARELIAPFNDYRTTSRIAFSAGKALHDAQRYGEAVERLAEAVTAAEKLGGTTVLAESLELLATALRETGDRETETGVVQRVVELHARTGSPVVAEWQARWDELRGRHGD